MTVKEWIDTGVKIIFAAAIAGLYFVDRPVSDSVVYIDSQKLVLGYKGTQQARKELETKAAAMQANLDTLHVEIETKVKEYESRKNSLSARDKQELEGTIHTKQEQFVSYQKSVSEKVAKDNEELSTKVREKLNAYLKKYGKEKGCKIILAATQYGNIVYATEGINVTDEVMKGLNEEIN